MSRKENVNFKLVVHRDLRLITWELRIQSLRDLNAAIATNSVHETEAAAEEAAASISKLPIVTSILIVRKTSQIRSAWNKGEKKK